jgi:hypothetical protein
VPVGLDRCCFDPRDRSFVDLPCVKVAWTSSRLVGLDMPGRCEGKNGIPLHRWRRLNEAVG